MSAINASFVHTPWILPVDSWSPLEVLALVGAVIWVAALAWIVLADVFRTVNHATHKHHHEDEHHAGSPPDSRRTR